MEHLRKSHSISNLVSNWSDEQRGDLQFELLHAIANGLLVVTDPLVDSSVLDTASDADQFLDEHPNYHRGYWLSGDEVIFRCDFLTAILEYIEYGSPKTVELATLYAACNYLCIRKTDFLQYLKKQRRPLPAFWFSPAERTVLVDVSTEDIGRRLTRIESELNARRGIPSLLELWFLHDTWTRQQGLMLMSDLSPSTKFDYDYNTFDERIRKVSYLETLDGIEHDPRDGHSYEQKLAIYESIWDSGDHPQRATPQYFVDWAVAKQRPPSWLHWAVEKGLLSRPEESVLESDRELGDLQAKVMALEKELERVRSDALQGKSKSMALSLIGGFAMIGAELDIHKARLDGIGEVMNDLAAKGVNVNEDTLRKYLRDAAKEIERQREGDK